MVYTQNHKEAQKKYRQKMKEKGYIIYTKYVTKAEAAKLNTVIELMRRGL